MADHIAFYGKGGVGKSTLISNISAALTEAGFRILQVGCATTGDSCNTLNGGRPIPTVCDILREKGTVTADEAVHYGFKKIATLEIGTPGIEPGGSAAIGVRRIFDILEQERVFELVHADFILYDISGESCFEAYYKLLEKHPDKRIFIVTTADYMSLRWANEIFAILSRFGDSQVPIPFGGLIPNGISSSFEDSFIADFANNTSVGVLGRVPRSLMVRQCELYGKTVIEASPLSNQSYFYRRLANQIVDVSGSTPENRQPNAMTTDQMNVWAREWADRLFALENGLVTDGAAI
jgi:nitrogenase iron protein NifH